MSVLTGKLARALIYTGRLTPHYNGLETWCSSTWFQIWLRVCWRQMALKNTLTLGPHISKCLGGAFLVDQWLRICPPMQGTWVQTLVWEDPTSQLSLQVTTTEALVPRVCSTTRGGDIRAHLQSSPCSLQLEKSLQREQWRLSTAKNKYINT